MKLPLLVLLQLLVFDALANPVPGQDESLFQCYFHSDYIPNAFATVLILKASNSCRVSEDVKTVVSHLRGSGIDGLIAEESINCYKADSDNIKNGLTSHSKVLFEAAKLLQTTPPDNVQTESRVDSYLPGSNYIEKIGWFSAADRLGCSYVYLVDSEPVGHGAGYVELKISVALMTIFSTLPYLVFWAFRMQ